MSTVVYACSIGYNKSRQFLTYRCAQTLGNKMVYLSALTQLVLVFVVYCCASPITQPKLQSGYVESGQYKVSEVQSVKFQFDSKKLLYISVGQQRLHVQVHCQSAVLSGRLTSELHIVCRGHSELLLR